MTPQTSSQTFTNRRLEKASKYVSDYWFPVNSELLSKIQNGLAQGRYENDLPALIDDVKSDFSLFVFSLKRLVEMIGQDGGKLPEAFNPVELMQIGGMDLLKQILTSDTREISKHTLASGSDFQLARFKEAMLSATTAETLSQSYKFDPETAYSAALLRQLGFVLVAWNYPSLYQEALSALKPGDKLDLVLTQSLGFSPMLLAMRLLSNWGVPVSVCESLGFTDEMKDEEQAITSAIGNTLVELCKVGEALARASDPERYPEAREDWEFAKQEIDSRLGSDGILLIQERYRENLESYLTHLPHIFESGLILDQPSVSKQVRVAAGTSGKNPYLGLCTNEVQAELRKLYLFLGQNLPAHDNTRMFVRDTVPACGFSRGCIYSIDPGMMMLVPMLEIGNERNKSFKAVDYSVIDSDSDMVAVAFQSSEPVIGYKIGEFGATISAIAGVFGTSQRMGVLYLEIPRLVSSSSKDPDLLHFKALQHALNDSLSL